MGTIIVTGVPGVGKTTVVDRAAEELGLDVVVYGTEMLRVAKKRGLVENRDEMRKLDAETQREIQQAAAESIAAKGRVIVDTHGFIRTPSGYLPGIPKWVADSIDPETVVLVEAGSEAIAERRAEDESRDRDEEDAAEIREHQQMNRQAASVVSTLTGATVAIVENADGEVDRAVQDFVDVVE
jgi:adenylate kinase